jgi:phage shock protein C
MNTSYKQLTRSTTNRMIAGICAGMGEFANIDPTIVRLIAVILIFLTGPVVVVGYLVMALIIPEKQSQ